MSTSKLRNGSRRVKATKPLVLSSHNQHNHGESAPIYTAQSYLNEQINASKTVASINNQLNRDIKNEKQSKLSNTAGGKLQSISSTGRRAKESEYHENFVEWELPEKQPSLHEFRSHNNIKNSSQYHTDMNVANRSSETKRSHGSYHDNKNHDQRHNDVRHQSPPRPAWSPEDDQSYDPNYITDPNYPKGSSVASSGGDINRLHREVSEHNRQFPWPAVTERTQVVRPPATGNPLVRDNYNEGSDMYRSEYADRNSALQNTQKNRAATETDPAAGVQTKAVNRGGAVKDQITQSAPFPEYNVGASESKLRYKWPEPQFVAAAEPPASNLNVFRSTDQHDAFRHAREKSVAGESYVVHDTRDIVRGVQDRMDSTAGRGLEKNPMSFAWPSGRGNDDLHHMQMNRSQNGGFHHSTRDDYGKNVPYSEYTRKFYWKDPTELENQACDAPSITVHKSEPHEQLNLFQQQGRDRTDVASEYKRNFNKGFDTVDRFHQQMELPVAGTTTHPDPAYPSQFAWGVPSGDEDREDLERKRRTGVNNPNVQSEYNLKYHWQDPELRNSPNRQKTLSSQTALKQDFANSIIGLDERDMRTAEWRSEYEENFARLRSKQQELSEHIAGVASQTHDKFPTFYAWKDIPPQASSPSKARPAGQIVHSEYEDKFVKFPLYATARAGPDSPQRPAQQASLNLFANGGNGAGRPQTSEYRANYQSGADTAKDVAEFRKTKVEDNPPQFAWSVLDGYAPPKLVATKKRPSGVPEESEYDSKYHWPAPAEKTELKRTIATPGGFKESPLGLFEADKDASQWRSEYEAAMRLTADESSSPTSVAAAGLITLKHGEIPSFYAWADQEAAKQVVSRTKLLPVDPVHSEYEEKFVKWSANEQAAAATKIVPVATAQTLKLFSDKTEPNTTSEYNRKFTDFSTAASASHSEARPAVSERNPPQFAWPLVDQERVKPERSKPTSDEASEYDTKYSWPQQGIDSSVNGRNSAQKQKKPSDGIFGTAEEGEASQWSSEYDAHTLDAHTSHSLVPTATAGLVTDRHGVIPSFYAWPPAPPVPVKVTPPVPPSERMHSEYEDKFVQWPAAPTSASAAVKTKSEQIFSASNKKFDSISEYDAKFLRHPDCASITAHDGTAHDREKPMQFAWSLQQQKEAEKAREIRDSHPFTESSEYDSRFLWPAETDLLASRQNSKPHYGPDSSSADLLMATDANARVRDWQSEYDNRCAELRRIQQQNAPVEQAVVYGIHSAPTVAAPAFYAWKQIDAALPAVAYKIDKSRSMAKAVTEYDAQYAKPEQKNRESHDALSVSLNNSKKATVPLLKPEFQGLSEYDDKFGASRRPVDLAVVREVCNHENTLRHTNIEQKNLSVMPAAAGLDHARTSETVFTQDSLCNSAAHKLSSEQKAKRSQAGNSGANRPGAFSTEARDSFKWPKNKQRVAESSAKFDGRNSKIALVMSGADKENHSGNRLSTPASESHSQFTWGGEEMGKPVVTSGILKSNAEIVPNKVVRNNAQKHTRPVSSFSDADSLPSKNTLSTAPNKSDKSGRHVHLAEQADQEDDSTLRVLPTSATSITELSSNSSGSRSSKHSQVRGGQLKSPDDEFFPSTLDSVAPSDCGASSSTITSYRPTANSPDNSSTQRSKNYVDFRAKNKTTDSLAGIPGLRFPLDNYQMYRARSAPPRKRLATTYTVDQRAKTRMFVDESASNPVLIHKRYPYSSDKQLNRWSTESQDNFKWRKSAPSLNN